MKQLMRMALALALAVSFVGLRSTPAAAIAAECGNGILEPGEQCDSGGTSSVCCDANCVVNPACGCCDFGVATGRQVAACSLTPQGECSGAFYPEHSCQPNGCEPIARCGNEVVEPGEQCDDGGTEDGDCCSSECQFETLKSPCGDDKNACTVGECDGKGLCETVPREPLPKSCGCCEYAPAGRSAPANYCYIADDSSCFGSFFPNAACTEFGCQGAVCGNGIVEEGEDCDTGGSDLRGGASECCDAATCKWQQAGFACSDDDNGCTDDVCDAAGECTHPNNSAPCDDFDLCTDSDICSDGVCAGTPFVPAECDDDDVCTDDGCGDGVCTHADNAAPCDDGQFCTEGDTCSEGVCQNGSPKDCTAGNICETGSCDEENDQCTTVANPEQNGQSCDDADACTDGTTCADGTCGGGSATLCDDMSTCTNDSCDPQSGCVFDTVVESPACGSCEDGEDNDEDGDLDGEDCGCATLCAQQRFAIVSTFVPNRPTRHALYCGSNVRVDDSPMMTPFATGGVCTTNAAYRAGANVGHIAATGSSIFGKGSSLTDPNATESGSDRTLVVRQRFDSDGGLEITKGASPFVGPGTCSQDALQMCAEDANCGAGNSCQGQLHLNDVGNAYVSRDGLAENYTRCVDALATVASEATFIATLAPNVPGFTDGTAQLRTSGGNKLITVTVGAGQQVMYVNRIIVTGKTVLRLVRDPMLPPNAPPTVLVVRVRRQLRLGGEAEIQLAGIAPENLIWNAEGTAGGKPTFLRSSKFKGTVIAADRRGVNVGGTAQVDGAIKARRIHIGQGSTIHHFPFKPLLQ